MNRTKVDVILEAIGLDVVRRRERRAWLRCPFHETRKAVTFFVRTSGERWGNYHCFSCKAKGTIYQLVAHARECDLREAHDFVEQAGRGFEPPRARARVVARAPDVMRGGFAYPDEIVTLPLEEWDTLPRRYAIDRGLTAEEVELHGIGFAVDGPLAGRIVFPFRDSAGRVVSYSARTFVDEEPKYKTPSEEDRADLDAIFGEHLWPPPGEREVVVVNEGALDSLAVVRATELPGGAIGGSDVRAGHITTLATFELVVVMTDNDKAGKLAASRLMRGLGRYVRTARVLLPEGDDAAKICKRDGPAALRRYVDRAIGRGAS